ncbi:MAG: acyl-protein synthetase [SAR324 cluster bacterium]|nr:acyl-protein synthetase [SAR324 cluster bacterium]
MDFYKNIFEASPYSLNRIDKEQFILPLLHHLTLLHYEQCKPYSRLLDSLYDIHHTQNFASLSEVPYFPVQLFKTGKMQSVRDEEVVKTLTSSATTSQQVSKIALDKETSMLQTKALVSIITSFIGPKRLPMIILDSKSIFKDRAKFSARGAGILGFSNFGRDHFYALDENMDLDLAGLKSYIEKYSDQTIFIFGFTFMIWQYFYQVLKSSDEYLLLNNAILLHGGGWKKLQENAVTNTVFKDALSDRSGIQKVYNYYGMVEQTGSIFMECDHGFFHAPNFSDILIRDYRDWSCLPDKESGVLQTLSVLPKSYPGHSLLTEDLGTIQGVDSCCCGRKGTYFSIEGRIPTAEIRGCSDTHAQDALISNQVKLI